MVVLKHVPMPDVSCPSTATTPTVLKAPSRVTQTRYLVTRLSAQTTAFISVANNHRSGIKTKNIKKPVGEYFDMSVHTWKDMTEVVIGHNLHWTDAERKKQGNVLDAQTQIMQT